MAQQTEPNVVGKRERLADLIAISDMRATPFTTRVQKANEGPKNMQYSWLVDNYNSPSTGGTVDGTDVKVFTNATANRARLYNYAQLFRESYAVSILTEEMTTVPTISSEIRTAAQKMLITLKRDLEAAILGGNDAQADNGQVPYLTCAMDTWISTAGPTTFPVPAAYRTVSGAVNTTATASLTEADIQNLLKAIYDATGMDGDYAVYCGSTFRRKFTDMTRTDTVAAAAAVRVRMFSQPGTSTDVTDTVTVYNGDYGSMEVITSQFLGWDGTNPDIDRAYVLNMDKLAIYSPVMPNIQALPDNGGGPRGQITAVAGLRVTDGGICHGKFKP